MNFEQEKIAQAFIELTNTIAKLRDPENGCPWDLEQDHKSLIKYMLEEAYEASDSMLNGSQKEICNELGDVLLQVVLNAQIAKDNKQFTILEVIDAITQKMKRRHPHVFSENESKKNKPPRS